MPYYAAGDYYRGDYYRGDIFGAIKKGLSAAGKAVLKIAGATPAGQVVKALLPKPQAQQIITFNPPPAPAMPISRYDPSGTVPGFAPTYGTRRRHMNVTNVKALRRAGRRVKGFLRIAQRLGALPVNRGKGKQLFKRKRR